MFDGAEELFEKDDPVKDIRQTYHLSMSLLRGRGKVKRGFPSAAAFADALTQDPYGGFDVMDFERPSLRAKKGKRAVSDLGLSDEDLKADMQ
ncbi:hypothetical protein LPUS_09561, partial [Lasallia pustulata]